MFDFKRQKVAADRHGEIDQSTKCGVRQHQASCGGAGVLVRRRKIGVSCSFRVEDCRHGECERCFRHLSLELMVTEVLRRQYTFRERVNSVDGDKYGLSVGAWS